MSEATTERKSSDWLWFLISTAICLTLLVLAPEYFWLALPAVLTFFVRALGVI